MIKEDLIAERMVIEVYQRDDPALCRSRSHDTDDD